MSVVLAWLNDSWGDSIPDQNFQDSEQARLVKRAAKRVRDLVQIKIGSIQDYRSADELFEHVVDEGKQIPRDALDPLSFKRGTFYRRLRRDQIFFHILWVQGDYAGAEQSFLKINKTGRQLSDWETKLVENRNSSLARLVMSVANIVNVKHYWPEKLEDGDTNQVYEDKAEQIREKVQDLAKVLFQPPARQQIAALQQPFLVAPDEPTRPAYLAELFTVIEGGKGQAPETDKLLRQDADAKPPEIVDNGLRRARNATEVFDHFAGTSSRSLGIVPLLYFYSEAGRYTRHLLYGLIYWLFNGQSEEELVTRKKLLCAHREAFERVLRAGKEDIITGLTRKSGSGAEVTRQAAQYYQDVLALLIKYGDDDKSKEFSQEYKAIAHKVVERRMQSAGESSGRSRAATPRQRRQIKGQAFLDSAVHCEICGGLLDPAMYVEFDHIQEWQNAGSTHVDNLRMTHPFCNNQRTAIEAIRQGRSQVHLPTFDDQGPIGAPKQLRLIDLSDFDPSAQYLFQSEHRDDVEADGLFDDLTEE